MTQRLFARVLAALAPLALIARAQEPEAERRFSFAQTYVGADWLRAGAAASVPRVTVGGLHFWGHADFFVTFALQRPRSVAAGGLESLYSPAGVTGGNVYPWALRRNTIRPFAGFSWAVSDFSLRSSAFGEGPRTQVHAFPIRAGVGILRGPMMLEVMTQYVPEASTRYPVPDARGRIALQKFALPVWQAGLSVRYVRDTTRGERSNYENAAERIRNLRQRGAWNTVYAGAGVSSALFTRSSEFNRAVRPSLQGGLPGVLFPGFYGGYHWADKDLLFNVAFRRMTHTATGWGDRQRHRRTAVTVEVSKFLPDYHGFAPFVGAGVSSEALSFRDRPAAGAGHEMASTIVRPGFVIGWDIRPSKTIPAVIRTSLRYTPALNMNLRNHAVPAPDFEFDFFQFVFYPKRFGRKH